MRPPGARDDRWDEMPVGPSDVPPVGAVRRTVARFVPPGIVAGVLWWFGRPVVAAVVAIVGLLLGAAAMRWPRVDRTVARVLTSVGHGVGRVLTTLLLGVVAVLILLPVAVIGAVIDRHPRHGVRAAGCWVARAAARPRLARRTYTLEADVSGSRAGWHLAVEAVGWVGVVVALDLALGWVWSNALTPYDSAVEAIVAPADAQGVDTGDPASTPAMQGSSWATAYFEALDSLEYEFVPYVTGRAEDHESRYINIEGDLRRSYQVRDLPPDAPTVWFFGGSTTWGEGQRDRHTIPSEVARLAEAAGTSVRVENFGQRGDVIWQELLRFERALASHGRPDLVVFYDGMNELLTQVEQGEPGQPTVFNADTYTTRLRGGGSAGGLLLGAEGRPVETVGEAVWLWWREHSALARLTERVQAEFAVLPAAAQDLPLTGDDLHDAVPEAVDVYTRAREVLLDIADDHDVEILLTWQPDRQAAETEGYVTALEHAGQLVGPPTVDLSGALDDVPVDQIFIDGGHTNERGARLVAEALWPLIREALPPQAAAG